MAPDLQQILDRAVRGDASPRTWVDLDDYRGVTPGGVLAYGDEQRERVIPFGRSALVPDRGFVVTERTIYDIASLTKPIATAATLARLAADGLDIAAPAAELLPELAGSDKRAIELRHLLGHASGLPAHIEFFRRLRSGERCGARSRREALLRMAAREPLACPPGTRTIYSDLGYILLGFAIERATGRRLDDATRALVLEPLGMRDTSFVDLDDTARAAPAAVAPTEQCPYRGLVSGEVHDDNAHAGGGIFGHAGLLSTAPDVARFARAMLAALSGDTAGPFAPKIARRFASESAAPETTWRLGWDAPSTPGTDSHLGDTWPRWPDHPTENTHDLLGSIGHLGFTGCGMWLDLRSRRYAVLLTNRVHPQRDNVGIRGLRRAVTDAVAAALSDM